MTSQIPFFKIHRGPEEEEVLLEVARSGWWSTGEKTAQLEQEFAAYVGSKYAVFLNSGTMALHLAFMALGLRNTTYKVPSFTFTATASEVVHSGNKVEFIDVDMDTLCASGKYDTPLVKVHYGGNFSQATGVPTVEDSAHLIQRDQCKNNPNLVCFSMAYNKNVTASEGGLVATNDEKTYKWLLAARLFGMDKHGLLNSEAHPDWPYSIEFLGWKGNASEFQAALGLVQFRKLDKINAGRKEIVERYNHEFGYRWQGVHLYPVFVEDRIKFLQGMKDLGIQCSVHYIPLHWMPAYKNFPKQDLTNTEWLGKHLVTIPLYSDLTEEEIERIVNASKKSGPMLQTK